MIDREEERGFPENGEFADPLRRSGGVGVVLRLDSLVGIEMDGWMDGPWLSLSRYVNKPSLTHATGCSNAAVSAGKVK